MPSLEENQLAWSAVHDWSRAGEEWSEWWGSAEAQWRWSLLPRIGTMLPASSILEIAPGYGRWTHYLREQCDHLTVVDLSERCIDVCRERFAGDERISYFVNDGRSLAMLPDGSIDFVFSFDSLVHAEADVMREYIAQLARKLTPHGIGFIHHSNWGAYPAYHRVMDVIPSRKLRKGLAKLQIMDGESHWRARSMTAELFERYAREAGLACIGQELVNWGVHRLCDCFSVFVPAASPRARPNQLLRNPGFMEEAALIKRVARIYRDAP